MLISMISKYIIIIFALLVFTICIELSIVQAATISEDKLQEKMDKKGKIPIPNLLVSYTVSEYYEHYYSSAYLTIYVVNFVFLIVAIKVLFFENIERNYDLRNVNIGMIFLVFMLLFSIVISIIIIKTMFFIKNNGINLALDETKGFKAKIVSKYLTLIKSISKTEDIQIANNKLWLQFFINKSTTIILISVIFIIKILIIMT